MAQQMVIVGVVWMFLSQAWAATVVGVVLDGAGAREAGLEQLIRDEVRALTAGEFDVQFPEDKRRVGDWTGPGARAAIDGLLADPQVNVVLALGILASDEAIQLKSASKPILAPFVIDAELQGISTETGGTGLRNISWLLVPGSLEKSVGEALALTGRERATLLVAPAYRDVFGQPERVGSHPVRVVYSETPPTDLGPSDVLVLGPAAAGSGDRRKELLSALNQAKVPTFAALDGAGDVEAGALAGHGRLSFVQEISRRVAVNVQRILFRDDLSTFPTIVAGEPRLLINLETARAIGFSPRWEDLFRATVLNPTAKGRPLDLMTAIDEALQQNLGLQAGKDDVEAARSIAYEQAYSQLFPQVELGFGPTFVDQKTSDAALGMIMSMQVAATLKVKQVLLAEPLIANAQIQKRLQTAREFGLEVQAADLVLAVATSYINALRAKNFEDIQNWAFELTRVNLDLARTRQRLGVAGPSEVLRWESQFASLQADLIDATSKRAAAERALNRVIGRPLDEAFVAIDTELVSAEGALLSGTDWVDLVDSPDKTDQFVKMLVEDGLTRSATLMQVDASMQAQERALQSVKLGRFIPTAGVQANFQYRIADNWEKPEFGEIDPETQVLLDGFGIDLAGMIPEIEEMPEFQYFVAGSVTLPIFNGGQRVATIHRMEGELAGMQKKRAAGARQLEEGIRASFAFLQASWWKVERTEEAVRAAERGLELAVNAYGQGAISILDLLDAQTRAVTARLVFAEANYSFRQKAWELQRLMGRFEMLETPEERKAWSDKARQWVEVGNGEQ